MKFVLENVRCFAGRHEFNIKPLTLIVGENSSGKTTLLACMQVLDDELSLDGVASFNRHPYHLGSFSEIAHKSNASQSRSFSLERSVENNDFSTKITYAADADGSLMIDSISYINANGKITFHSATPSPPEPRRDSDFSYKVDLLPNKPSSPKQYRVTLGRPQLLNTSFISQVFFEILLNTPPKELEDKNTRELSEFLQETNRSLPKNIRLSPRFISFSPLRAEPRRTYDFTELHFDPSGSEIPLLLKRIKNKGAWNKIEKPLVEFGRESGMFDSIEVKNLGESPSDPFQLKVRSHGVNANIIDVGYGVSQVLPLLVYTILPGSRPSNVFLIQQPEVHLHPQAQAALASFFIKQRRKDQYFVIEHHSDYILDRARIEIQRGTIKAEEVALIYLESDKDRVRSYNITFDKRGNIVNPPESYRTFFDQEFNRFFKVGA